MSLLMFVVAAATATAVPGAPAAVAAPKAVNAAPNAAAAGSGAAASTAEAVAETVAFPKGVTPAQAQLVTLQVLLDRAHFSPGVIDGRSGGNLDAAAAAYRSARSATGDVPALIKVLAAADGGPVLATYTITDADAAGPYLGTIPSDYEEMARLKTLGYRTPREALAERFHMDEALLGRLNPGAAFGVAGTRLVVAAVSKGKLDKPVARIDVDKTASRLTAYDAAGTVLAVYPATVGSTERPAPSGDWAVRTVAPAPTYTYDPKRLTFGKPKAKLTIAAGPNNPVGSTWIDLTKDTYGIHGTPDPVLVGKRASHGCVRLTNWDAAQLGASVAKGTKVSFVGAETRAKT